MVLQPHNYIFKGIWLKLWLPFKCSNGSSHCSYFRLMSVFDPILNIAQQIGDVFNPCWECRLSILAKTQRLRIEISIWDTTSMHAFLSDNVGSTEYPSRVELVLFLCFASGSYREIFLALEHISDTSIFGTLNTTSSLAQNESISHELVRIVKETFVNEWPVKYSVKDIHNACKSKGWTLLRCFAFQESLRGTTRDSHLAAVIGRLCCGITVALQPWEAVSWFIIKRYSMLFRTASH